MNLPYLTAATSKSRKQIITFAGLNYGQGGSDGELAESEGLSSAQFPCLSQRQGRRTEAIYTAPTALYARGKLLTVEGERLLYGGVEVGSVCAGEKMMATINTKVCIWPDKVYLDTETETLHAMALSLTYPAETVQFGKNTLTVETVEEWTDEAQEETAEVILAEDVTVAVYTAAEIDLFAGTFTMTGDGSTTPNGLTRGQIMTEGCEEGSYLVVETVTRRESGGAVQYRVTGVLHKSASHARAALEEVVNAGDALTISGCETCEGNNGSHLVRSVAGNTLTFDADIFSAIGTESGCVTLERKVPDFTCVCECDNRIWGAAGQTIYASALGDPTNFFVYDGLSTDSYAAAVGTDGEFTGCIAYSSTVLFFKENCLHKVLGSYPAQYEIYTYKVPGVQKGSEKSLAIMNELLFYKGCGGVYVYSGGAPELLTENFGQRRFFDAAGGTDGTRYYISMRDEAGIWGLYTYDTRRGIWLREDATHVLDFACLDGTLYYLDAASGALIATGQETEETGLIAWSATLCRMDETSHGRKSYSKLYLRAELEEFAWFSVEVRTDGGAWRRVYTTHNERARGVQVPILPTRCDWFQIRLSGKGGCLVKSIVREFAVGSAY